MSKQEVTRIINSINSLIDIDIFFEDWEDVKFLRVELQKAESILKTL